MLESIVVEKPFRLTTRIDLIYQYTSVAVLDVETWPFVSVLPTCMVGKREFL